MQQAEELRENSDLEAARSLLQEIVSLDPYNEAAPLVIAEVDAEIREMNFPKSCPTVTCCFRLMIPNQPSQRSARRCHGYQRAGS